MSKILIIYNNVKYEGFDEEKNIKKLQYDISAMIYDKGYYLLKTIDGIKIMFPRNALLNAVVKLIRDEY